MEGGRRKEGKASAGTCLAYLCWWFGSEAGRQGGGKRNSSEVEGSVEDEERKGEHLEEIGLLAK